MFLQYFCRCVRNTLAYAERYLRNPENNVDNQRYLTEEFLANCANAEVKPSWWKEFIAKIRAWLRQFKPGLQFTNRDIEGAISLAYRRVRRGGMFDSAVVKDNLTTENGATSKENLDVDGVRFMAEPGTVENGGERKVTELKKLDHSQYQENTMLSGDEDIALIDIPQEYKTVDAAEKEIAEKIKHANGRLIAVNEDQKMDILIQSNDSLDEAASEKALNETLSDGTSAEIHAAALANIEQLLSKARLGVSHRDWHTYAKNQQRGTNKETALQIHRFYTAMQYGDDIYGVKMTVREKQNGSTVFYTLEAHDLDIEKINPETESSRGGVVKAALPGRSPAIKFSSFFEKFKPVDDLLGLKYKNKYPNIRFSVSPVYTGSAADYDQPSLQFIGSGEGAQVYGWGLYGTSNIEVATWYAKADGQRKYSKDTVLLDGREIDYNFSDDGNSFEDIKRSALLDVKRHKGYIDAVITEYQGYIEEDGYSEDDVEWLKTSIDFLENNRDRITFRPAGDDAGKRHIYSQTFWPGKQENLLEWEKSVPVEQLDLIAEALKAAEDNTDLNGNERTDTDKKGGVEYERKKFLTNLGFNKAAGISGGQLYEQMVYIFGSPKAASEFLYRAGIDGITYIGDSSGVRNYVAFSDKDIRVDGHYRFLLAEFTPEERRDITLILKPYVGFALNHTDLDYVQYLADRGVNVSEKDAHAFAVTAMRENIDEANQRNAEKRKAAAAAARERRDQWIYANTPLYREAVEFAGTKDFKIKPSGRFRGEDFSGSFISPEFVKYSRSKKKDDSKLDSAAGVNSNEFAAALARKWGRDELQLEQEIIDYFRDLKKTDLFRDYSDFRKNQILEDKEADRLAYEEALKIQQSRVEEEVIHILEHGLPITEEYVKENPEVYKELHRQILKEEPPEKPRKKDIDVISSAVQNDKGSMETYIAAYRDARKKSAEEYMAKLRELRDKVMESKADAVQLQKDAWNIARLRLPAEEQAGFVRSILNLMELSTEQNKKYPEGRRQHEFRNIIHKIDVRSRILRANVCKNIWLFCNFV